MTAILYPAEKPKDYIFQQYKLVGGNVVELQRIVAHSFEVDDSTIKNQLAGQDLFNWCISDRGQWVMENAFETPYYEYYKHPVRWTTEFKVVATFTTKKLTEYYLRFS